MQSATTMKRKAAEAATSAISISFQEEAASSLLRDLDNEPSGFCQEEERESGLSRMDIPSSIPVSSSYSSASSSSMVSRGPLVCKKCKGHGSNARMKGHGICPFNGCSCSTCQKVDRERQWGNARRYAKIVSQASQVAVSYSYSQPAMKREPSEVAAADDATKRGASQVVFGGDVATNSQSTITMVRNTNSLLNWISRPQPLREITSACNTSTHSVTTTITKTATTYTISAGANKPSQPPSVAKERKKSNLVVVANPTYWHDPRQQQVQRQTPIIWPQLFSYNNSPHFPTPHLYYVLKSPARLV